MDETVRIPLKRSRSECITDQVQEAKKTKQSSNTPNVTEMIKTVIEKSNFGISDIIHDCKCWVIVRVGHTWPMLPFRKKSSSGHDKKCQAAVKTGNKTFKIINCDGNQKIIGESNNHTNAKWYKTFVVKQCELLPELNSEMAEYFQLNWTSSKNFLPQKSVIMGLNGYQILSVESTDELKENCDLFHFKPFWASGFNLKKKGKRLDLGVKTTDMSEFSQLGDNKSLIVFHSCKCWLVFGVFGYDYADGRPKNTKLNFNHSFALRRNACKQRETCKIVPDSVHNQMFHISGATKNALLKNYEHFFKVTNCLDQTFSCYHLRKGPISSENIEQNFPPHYSSIKPFQHPLKVFYQSILSKYLKKTESFIIESVTP